MTQKFRVHSFQTVRFTYEVVAESAVAACEDVTRNGWKMMPVNIDLEEPEWTEDFIVDPLLPDGEIDYDNVRLFSDKWPEEGIPG